RRFMAALRAADHLIPRPGTPVTLGQERVAAATPRCLPTLQPSLDVDLLALRQILGQRFGLLPPDRNAMPLGLLLALAAFVVPHFRRGHVDRGDRCAARRVSKLGIASEIADEDQFVDAAHWKSFGR